MAPSSRRCGLIRVVLLVTLACADGSRYAARRPQAAPAAPRAEAGRRAPSRKRALLLAAAPLLVSAQFEDIETEFKEMDSDGDGLISKQEFIFRGRRIVELTGLTDETEIAGALRSMGAEFDDADTNRDGELDLSETHFLAFLAEMRYRGMEGRLDGEAEVRRLFNAADEDKDGRISEAELLSATPSDGEGKLDRDIVIDTFAKGDLDGDESLNRQEWQYATWRLSRHSDTGAWLRDNLTRSFYEFWDGDRDGKITKKELARAAATTDGSASPWPIVPIALENAQRLFEHCDGDGDGMWDAGETASFASWVVTNFLMGDTGALTGSI